MSRSLHDARVTATSRAEDWLRRTPAATAEMEALRRLGLVFCAHAAGGANGWQPQTDEPIVLPRPASFMTMDRGRLLELSERLSLGAPEMWHVRASYRERWGRYFGGVALSYARIGDASMVAVLVRAAAHLHLWNAWLYEAEEYLLDQQQPEGYFGLLAQESASLDEGAATEALLRLTVEVVWALAETATLERLGALRR